jgi:hypothetical protein
VLAALVAAGNAHADGDPASDVLYVNWVFVPFNSSIPKDDVTRLKTVVDNARAAHYPIKVALIGVPSDLGTAFALWRKPQRYARFLGLELQFLYKGPLLIVMPNGFGFFRKAGATPEARALRGLRVADGTTGLARSAVDAVAALARSAGHPVAVPKAKTTSSGLSDRLFIILGAAVIVVAFTALELLRRRRRAA